MSCEEVTRIPLFSTIGVVSLRIAEKVAAFKITSVVLSATILYVFEPEFVATVACVFTLDVI